MEWLKERMRDVTMETISIGNFLEKFYDKEKRKRV